MHVFCSMIMKPALLVIDCQNDFIKNSSPYACQMLDKKLIQKIEALIDVCRKKKIPVVYTQHSIKPDKSNAEFGEPEDVQACIIGTKGWEIIDELRPQKSEAIVQKDKYDAFYNTSLDNTLKRLKVDTLILSGVLTNNCIRATAEGAHYRGYSLVIVSDCCGATSYIEDYSARQIHDFTLRDLKERVYETKLVVFKELAKKI